VDGFSSLPEEERPVVDGRQVEPAVTVFDQVLIRPDGPESSTIYYLPPGFNGKLRDALLLGSIGEAQSLVVGRDLRIHELFGLSRENGEPFSEIKAADGIESNFYSRGGLRILRLNGIYVFNCGVINHFRVVGYDGISESVTDFSGDSIVDLRGTISFGESRTFRKPPEEPYSDDPLSGESF